MWRHVLLTLRVLTATSPEKKRIFTVKDAGFNIWEWIIHLGCAILIQSLLLP